jgi:hypothetical protein
VQPICGLLCSVRSVEFVILHSVEVGAKVIIHSVEVGAKVILYNIVLKWGRRL